MGARPDRRRAQVRGQGTSLNDYVQVNNQNIKPPTTMTISAWVWADAIPAWASIVDNWPDDTAQMQVRFGMNALDGDLSSYLSGSGGDVIGPVREGLGTLMPLGTWEHVALVCNGQTMQLSRNGAAGHPVAYGGQINTNTLSYTLGFGAKIDADGTAVNYWKGKMDDIGMWTRGAHQGGDPLHLPRRPGGPAADQRGCLLLHPALHLGSTAGRHQVCRGVPSKFHRAGHRQGTLFQWNENDTALVGATNNTLSLYGPLTNSASYRVVVTDAGNGLSVTSAPAALTVNAVTSITTALAGYWPFNET